MDVFICTTSGREASLRKAMLQLTWARWIEENKTTILDHKGPSATVILNANNSNSAMLDMFTKWATPVGMISAFDAIRILPKTLPVLIGASATPAVQIGIGAISIGAAAYLSRNREKSDMVQTALAISLYVATTLPL